MKTASQEGEREEERKVGRFREREGEKSEARERQLEKREQRGRGDSFQSERKHRFLSFLLNTIVLILF